jgi:low affinity Fe/Cu permease
MNEFFHKIAHKTAEIVGHAWAFILALTIVIAWLIIGPAFDFSNTWQLWINTATTILTFLMVFLIQNTQNRDSKALHLKLDELIRASRPARDSMLDLEDLPDQELDRLQKEFERLRDKTTDNHQKRRNLH